MPPYPFLFNQIADIDTAYAEAYTVKKVFGVPYDKKGMPKLGTLAQAKANALAEAKKIAADMKDKNVKEMVANGKIPKIVALIAYLNGLK
jgi:cytochrome c oxidase cbb3-type subunit 2